MHQRLIEELGPELSQGRLTAKDLRPRVNAHLQAALADEATPLSPGRQGPAGRGHRQRHPRLRAHPGVPGGPERLRGHGQRARQGLRRARRQDRAHADVLHRRDPPAPGHRQDRRRGQPPRRRGVADGRRPPPRRLTCQRRDPPAGLSAARSSRSGSSPRTRSWSRTWSPNGTITSALARFIEACVVGTAEHHRVRRHRHREDDDAERPVVVRSPTTSASSPSRTPRSSSSARSTWSRWSRAPRTSKARARSRSATSCAMPCACAPTGSSSGSVVAARPSTCSRP